MHGDSHGAHAPVQSTVPARAGSILHNDGTYRGARRHKAARRPKGLMVFAAFAALSAVTFTVFTCSLFIRRMKHTSSFGRRMADKGIGGESDQQSDSCNQYSQPDQSGGFPPQGAPPFDPNNDNVMVAPMYSKGHTESESGKQFRPAPAAEVGESTVRKGAKRKADGALDENGEPSGRGFVPHLKGALLESPPPLDPAIDSLIDSVLAVGEHSLLGRPSRSPAKVRSVLPAADLSTHTVPSKDAELLFDKSELNGKESPPPLDPATDSLIDSLLAAEDEELLESFALDEETAPAPLDPDVDLLIESLLTKEEEALLRESRVDAEEPLSPLDAGVDALIDSLLAGEESGLLDDASNLVEEEMNWEKGNSPISVTSELPGDAGNLEPDHEGTSTAEMISETASISPPSEAGPSLGLAQLIGHTHAAFGGSEGFSAADWLPVEGHGLLQPADGPPATWEAHELQSGSGTSVENLESLLGSLIDETTRGKMDQGLSRLVGTVQDSSSVVQTYEELTSRRFEVSPSGTPVASEEETAAGESAVGTVSSAVSSAPYMFSGSPTTALLQPRSPTDESVSTLLLRTPQYFLGWLDNVYPGMSDEELKTHPFYRHPRRQLGVNVREFNESLASAMRTLHFAAYSLLGECRDLLKKTWLNLGDYETLMCHAERLCGYASGCMPVEYRRNRPLVAIESLGTIFLVVDMLHCLTEVLGSSAKREVWWPWVVGHIERARFTPYIGGRARRQSPDLDTAVSLSYVLNYYRRGQRPPVRLLVGLKEAILCTPGSTKFKSRTWDPWRQDVYEWRRERLGGGEHTEQSTQGSASGTS